MFSTLIRRRWAAAAAIAVVAVLAVAACGGSAARHGGNNGRGDPIEVNTAGAKFTDKLVVYNGRSHNGDEQVFRDFEQRTGVEIELRGGTSPELFERLQREGEDIPADLLITVDLLQAKAEAVAWWYRLSQLRPNEYNDAYTRERARLGQLYAELGHAPNDAIRAEQDAARKLGFGPT